MRKKLIKIFIFLKNVFNVIYIKIFDNSPLLLLIFLLALFLRELGTHPGYQLFHPDEVSIRGGVQKIILNGDFKPNDYYYGSLLTYIYAFFALFTVVPYAYGLSLFNFLILNKDTPFISLMRGFSPLDPSANLIYYWSRYDTAFICAFTPVVIYFIGKKLINKEVGFLAAFFTAVNYRHVLSSTFVLADAPAALFAALSVLFSIYIIKSPTLKTYFKAGFFLALALSVKYFIYVIPAFILCHIFSVFSTRSNFGEKIKNIIISKKLALSVFVCIVIFFAINPYLIIDYKQALLEQTLNASRYGLTNIPVSLESYLNGARTWVSIFPLSYFYIYGIGKIMSVLFLIGFLYGLVRYFIKTIIIASVIIPFLFIMTVISGTEAVRNYSAIIPFVLFFPAILIVDLVKIIKTKKIRLITLILLTFLIGFPSLRSSFLSSYYFSQPQNLKSAMNWVKENLTGLDGKTIENSYDVPVSSVGIKDSLASLAWSNYKYLTINEMRAKGIKFAVIGSHYTSVANNQFYLNTKVWAESSFDEKKIWEALGNTYISLALTQLADYRIKDFSKPFWEGMVEPAVMIIKVPPEVPFKNKTNVAIFDFENETNASLFSVSSPFPCGYFSVAIVKNEGVNDSAALVVKSKGDPSCAIETSISSPLFKVKPIRDYLFSGFLKVNGLLNPSGDGFFRLDFYSRDKKRIKTYVSSEALNNQQWQEINVEGESPSFAEFASVGFQLDGSYADTKFILDDLVISETDKPPLNKSEYPFCGKDMSRNFIWQFQL